MTTSPVEKIIRFLVSLVLSMALISLFNLTLAIVFYTITDIAFKEIYAYVFVAILASTGIIFILQNSVTFANKKINQ